MRYSSPRRTLNFKLLLTDTCLVVRAKAPFKPRMGARARSRKPVGGQAPRPTGARYTQSKNPGASSAVVWAPERAPTALLHDPVTWPLERAYAAYRSGRQSNTGTKADMGSGLAACRCLGLGPAQNGTNSAPLSTPASPSRSCCTLQCWSYA